MHPVIWHMTRNNSIVQICVSKLGKASCKSENGWSQPDLMTKQNCFARSQFLMNTYSIFDLQKNIIKKIKINKELA